MHNLTTSISGMFALSLLWHISAKKFVPYLKFTLRGKNYAWLLGFFFSNCVWQWISHIHLSLAKKTKSHRGRQDELCIILIRAGMDFYWIWRVRKAWHSTAHFSHWMIHIMIFFFFMLGALPHHLCPPFIASEHGTRIVWWGMVGNFGG